MVKKIKSISSNRQSALVGGSERCDAQSRAPSASKVSYRACGYQGHCKSNPLWRFSLHAAKNEKKRKEKANAAGWAEVPAVHHTLFSEASVCMTLLCSAVISVKALDKSASPTLPFSSEKSFLQWEIQTECQVRKVGRTERQRQTLTSPNM